MNLLVKITSHYRGLEKDQCMDRMHQSQYILHTKIMVMAKNSLRRSIIINMSISSFDDGAKSAWSADHKSLCERPCDVLPFIVWAAQSSFAFPVNRVMPLICLNIINHTLSVVLIYGFFAGHRRTKLSHWQGISGLSSLHEMLPQPA